MARIKTHTLCVEEGKERTDGLRRSLRLNGLGGTTKIICTPWICAAPVLRLLLLLGFLYVIGTDWEFASVWHLETSLVLLLLVNKDLLLFVFGNFLASPLFYLSTANCSSRGIREIDATMNVE